MANVTRLIGSLDERLPKAGVWPLCHSLAFDVSVWEIFGALLRGGRLVVVPDAVAGSPQEFAALLGAEQVSVLTQTPSALAVLPDEGLGGTAVVTVGEACPARGGGSVGARAGDGQCLRADGDDDVCGDQCPAERGMLDGADRVAGGWGGVVCA